MAAEGADLLDLGAESTRPGGGVYGDGARQVYSAEELDRLLPVLEGLRRETDLPLSVDTRKAAVAAEALAAGADLINDVGGLTDPQMLPTILAAGCPIVVMHSRGELASMQKEIRFGDVTAEVIDDLRSVSAQAIASGLAAEQMILDPGIGFGKGTRHNLRLLREIDKLAELGHPLLVGASRKSFIAKVRAAPPSKRLGGSLAAAAWAAKHGASILRVHDVAATVQFLDVWNAIDLAAASP